VKNSLPTEAEFALPFVPIYDTLLQNRYTGD
jgi:hypothetical protein